MLIGPLGTHFSRILIKIHTFQLKYFHKKFLLENDGLYVYMHGWVIYIS